jgi:hypothetical protein
VKISVVGPVLNEVEWIGYSIMAASPFVHEFVYALDEKSSDGTRELLHYLKETYLHERLKILHHSTFHPHNMEAYNESFNRCIRESTGEACWFLHPDMIVTEGPSDPLPEALAYHTQISSYSGDKETIITSGRCNQWKKEVWPSLFRFVWFTERRFLPLRHHRKELQAFWNRVLKVPLPRRILWDKN